RSDIRPEHDRQRGHQGDQAFARKRGSHQPGRGAALQYRGKPQSSRESRETVAERRRQQMPQFRAERAQDAALDHVQAPKQQRHSTHQIENDDRAHRDPFAAETPTGNPTGRYGASKAEPVAELPVSRIDVERLGPAQAAKPRHGPISMPHPPIDSLSTWRISGRTARILSKTSCNSSAPTKS